VFRCVFSEVSKGEVGVDVNTEETKCMVMSRDQNTGEKYKIKRDNECLERVEQFRYLGSTVTNQNSIHNEIKSTLKSEDACYHSVQNLLSSSLLSKNIKIKIYRTIILPIVLYRCETLRLSH
jgi:hypothetical protein